MKSDWSLCYAALIYLGASLGELSHIETQEMETESEKARAEFNESVNNLYTAATVLAGVTAFGLVSRMFSDPK